MPFEELDKSGKPFENFCLRLAAREPGIAWAVLKNKIGDPQYGVDIEGYSADNKPTLVISCKGHKTVRPNDIKNWGRDFLKHWEDHWKAQGVQVFILALTVAEHDKLTRVISSLSPQFQQYGIQLIPWWSDTLTEKATASPHQLILPFFSKEVTKRACGRDANLELNVFTERRFDARESAVFETAVMAPTDKDYRDGYLYTPNVLLDIEIRLHRHRLAYILGTGASGKSVLGNIIASKRYRFDHGSTGQSDGNLYALTDYCACLRLTPDMQLPPVMEDLLALNDSKTLVIIDDIHLNIGICRKIFSAWQELDARPYILFIGRQTNKTKKSIIGPNAPPIKLISDFNTVRGIYEYVTRKYIDDYLDTNEELFRDWAIEFGDPDGKNVDLVALSHVIRYEYSQSRRSRMASFRFSVAAEAVWDYYLESLPEQEYRNLIQLASIPDDMGLSGHALFDKTAQFKEAEARGIVLHDTILRSTKSEIRYRLSHSALGRLILTAFESRDIADQDSQTIRLEIFEKDPLSGILISLFEATEKESSQQTVASLVLSLNNLVWFNKYAKRGGLDTIRAFIEIWSKVYKKSDLFDRFLKGLLSNSSFRELFLKTPLRNRAEFMYTIRRVINLEDDKTEIQNLLLSLFQLQFNDINAVKTMEYIRKEPMSGIVRMLEVSEHMGFEENMLLKRDINISNNIVARAIDGKGRLNEFLTLFKSTSNVSLIFDLKKAAISALNEKGNIKKVVIKGCEEPPNMLASFLFQINSFVGSKTYQLYGRELSERENANKVIRNILREFEKGVVGAAKRLIDFVKFLIKSGSNDFLILATTILKSLLTEVQIQNLLLFSLGNMSPSYIHRFCHDLDGLLDMEYSKESKKELVAQLKILAMIVEEGFSGSSIDFFRVAIESGPLNEIASWYTDKYRPEGNCVIKAKRRLRSELCINKNIETLSERLPKAKQDEVLAFLKHSELHEVLSKVAKIVERHNWQPVANLKDTDVKHKKAMIDAELNRFYT